MKALSTSWEKMASSCISWQTSGGTCFDFSYYKYKPQTNRIYSKYKYLKPFYALLRVARAVIDATKYNDNANLVSIYFLLCK